MYHKKTPCDADFKVLFLLPCIAFALLTFIQKNGSPSLGCRQ